MRSYRLASVAILLLHACLLSGCYSTMPILPEAMESGMRLRVRFDQPTSVELTNPNGGDRFRANVSILEGHFNSLTGDTLRLRSLHRVNAPSDPRVWTAGAFETGAASEISW